MKWINTFLLVVALLIVGIGVSKAVAQTQTSRLCSVASYPKLHAVLVDYGQMQNWRAECGQHPRIIHHLLRTGCNQYECNYASGLAYRRWLRRFTIRHGGIPGDDLILGA